MFEATNVERLFGAIRGPLATESTVAASQTASITVLHIAFLISRLLEENTVLLCRQVTWWWPSGHEPKTVFYIEIDAKKLALTKEKMDKCEICMDIANSIHWYRQNMPNTASRCAELIVRMALAASAANDGETKAAKRAQNILAGSLSDLWIETDHEKKQDPFDTNKFSRGPFYLFSTESEMYILSKIARNTSKVIYSNGYNWEVETTLASGSSTTMVVPSAKTAALCKEVCPSLTALPSRTVDMDKIDINPIFILNALLA
jgi:hypothetical protein